MHPLSWPQNQEKDQRLYTERAKAGHGDLGKLIDTGVAPVQAIEARQVEDSYFNTEKYHCRDHQRFTIADQGRSTISSQNQRDQRCHKKSKHINRQEMTVAEFE